MVESASAKELKAMRDDMAALRQDIRDLVTAARSDGRSALDGLTDRIREASNHLRDRSRERLQETYSMAADGLATQRENLRHQISDRPLSSVAGALLAGLVIGSLLRR